MDKHINSFRGTGYASSNKGAWNRLYGFYRCNVDFHLGRPETPWTLVNIGKGTTGAINFTFTPMPASIAFDNTLGAALIGGLFAATLYGVTCIQTFVFLQSERNQKLPLQIVVWVLWVLDTVHMIFVAHALYWIIVKNFTNPTVLKALPWSISAGILLAPTSDTIVRSFFTYRVWVLSGHNLILTGPLAVAVFLVELDGMAAGIICLQTAEFADLNRITWIIYGGLLLAVVVDFYIAFALCYFLYTSRSGIKRTDSLVNVLLAYTINIGLLTSCLQLACFIMYEKLPGFTFLALYFPMSKFYVNSLLATLNARESLQMRGGHAPNLTTPISLTSLGSQFRFRSNVSYSTNPSSTSEAQAKGGANVIPLDEIHVHTVTDIYNRKDGSIKAGEQDDNQEMGDRHTKMVSI